MLRLQCSIGEIGCLHRITQLLLPRPPYNIILGVCQAESDRRLGLT